jgi:hypothetical protein
MTCVAPQHTPAMVNLLVSSGNLVDWVGNGVGFVFYGKLPIFFFKSNDKL